MYSTGIQGSMFLGVESRHALCAGFQEISADPRASLDRISIQGFTESVGSRNPHFVAVLEERVVSLLA